jgi:hypothetical protein
MAETLISDIIQPPQFLQYVVEKTAEKSELITSGIIDTDPTFVELANSGGSSVVMPFWNDLTGNSQVLSDTGSLVTKKITTGSDGACLHMRGDAWSTNDLAAILAGDDPMAKIIDRTGDYWARDTQHILIACLTGVFGSALMAATNSTDISVQAAMTPVVLANVLHGLTFVDAKQLLGDAKDKLTAIYMHSMVESDLLKRDLITFLKDSDGQPTLKMFQGLRVIVDDGAPTAVGANGATVFDTYLFGLGAFALGVGTFDKPIQGGVGNSTWSLEFGRVALASQNLLINRRRFILHPRGVKWLGASVAGESPSNAELALPQNWARVYEPKNVRLVRIRHNVMPD